MIAKSKTSITSIWSFLTDGIWRLNAHTLGRGAWFGVKLLRVIILSIRHFKEDKCMLRASALTFYTLLSMVPIIAMIFGISKGFNIEQKIREQITTFFVQKDVADYVMQFANRMLENTSGGVVAGIGIVVLFFTVIRVLGNIEESMNDIWSVKKSRPFARKFADYLALVVIAPIILIMSSSVNVFISNQVSFVIEKYDFLAFLNGPARFSLRLIPVLLIQLLLTFVYAYMPNRKVKVSAALAGALFAAILFQIFQWAYFKFQFGVSNYNAIYGSFAALPLFLLWLQISWSLMLFGAEVSFAFQTSDSYEFEKEVAEVSHGHRNLIALAIVTEVVNPFVKGEPGPTPSAIAEILSTPEKLVLGILDDLVDAKILSEIMPDEKGVIRYQPALDLDKLTVYRVLMMLRMRGSDGVPLADITGVKKLKSALDEFYKSEMDSQGNCLIRDLSDKD